MRNYPQAQRFPAAIAVVFMLALCSWAQAPQTKSVLEMYQEIDSYVSVRTKELVAEGKRMDASRREDIAGEKKALAEKYAGIAAKMNPREKDLYFLGLMYVDADRDAEALDTMKRFLAQYPPETQGDMIQSARTYVVAFSSQRKQLPDAVNAYELWTKGSPVELNQQPAMEQLIAVGFFKDGQYDQAIRYGQSAFDHLKTLKAKTYAEKRSREQLYANLIEVLALSYRKNKNVEQALEILAEARAESFALPSANLYRKVMDFVEGGGFSEKKLMQKVESYASADPAPILGISEWLGEEPVSFDKMRGKVVLLDFWATWCIPCISTFPRLRGWYKKYAGNDFTIVGVTQYYGQQDGKKMSRLQEAEFLKEFKQKYKLPYNFAVLENPGDAPMKYGVNAYPTTILLDRNGVVRYIGIGAGAEESENLENMIEKVLKEQSRLAVKVQ